MLGRDMKNTTIPTMSQNPMQQQQEQKHWQYASTTQQHV